MNRRDDQSLFHQSISQSVSQSVTISHAEDRSYGQSVINKSVVAQPVIEPAISHTARQSFSQYNVGQPVRQSRTQQLVSPEGVQWLATTSMSLWIVLTRSIVFTYLP